MLPGKPGSAEFMARYHELLAQVQSATPIGLTRVKPGTIDALVVRYLGSDTFKALSKATQDTWRPILDKFRQCVTPSGNRYGTNRLATIRPENIRDALADKPASVQRSWTKAINHLNGFAASIGEGAPGLMLGVKPARAAKSSGYLTWGEPQIEQYRARHPIGTMARLAMELALNMAGRRKDVHEMGRQHLRDGWLSWVPSKTRKSTGQRVTVPVLPEFQAALDAMPRTDALTFMLTAYGRPFSSAAAFGNRFAAWCKQAGFKPVLCDDGVVRTYSVHGLRKAKLTRLAHASCTGQEIISWSGHSNMVSAQPYLATVDRARMTEAAMAKIKRRTGSDQR
jgi:integrase/recombinase XerD